MGSSFVSGLSGGIQTADPGAGNDDGFIAKLNAAGALVNFTYLGSGGYDAVNAITLDAAGNVYATGQTWPFVGTTAFPITGQLTMQLIMVLMMCSLLSSRPISIR